MPRLKEINPLGFVGDPKQASYELGEKIVKNDIINDFRKENDILSRNTIQNVISDKLALIFKEIDKCLIHEFKKEKN